MHILFVHQNFPGQYIHLARELAQNPRHRVVGMGEKKERANFGYPVVAYDPPRGGHPSTHHYIRDYEGHIRRGQQVFRACQELKARGFVPDVICAHPGWGESLFLRDAFPEARILAYCEFFYRSHGSDMNFDPEFPADLDSLLKVRIKNSTQLQALCGCDAGISPTRWQQGQYPAEYRPRIFIQHDGIDTDAVCPQPGNSLDVGGNRTLDANDEVITYVARNLEPYRGFHSFMRALPSIQNKRPNAHVVIIGGNDVSYGSRLPGGQSYKDRYLAEIPVDTTRIHFLGRVPYPVYLAALRISSVHVYLTYPFVLSWSCLEAMSAGCALVASNTAPVQEIVEDGANGVLVDFFSPESIADAVLNLLDDTQRQAVIRQNARQTIIERFDSRRVTLPRLINIVEGLH